MSLRRSMAVAGRLLVGAGVLILLFVAYQLYGTNLSASRSQQALRHQLARELRASPPATAPASPGGAGSEASGPGTTATTGSRGPEAAGTAPTGDRSPDVGPPPPPQGDALAIIKIPRIEVDKAVVQGVAEGDLRKGPGHYPGTSLPGQPGNAAIAGHRTTYGAPFFRLNELGPGDLILVTTEQGAFRYRVTRSMVVSPSDVAVLGPTRGATLTLTTCNPRYSAAQRLVVQAALVGRAAPPSAIPAASGQAPAGAGRDGVGTGRGGPSDNPTLSVPDAAPATGLAGGQGGWVPSLLWGMALLLAGALVWLLSRRWGRHGEGRRWLAYLAGAPVCVALLFVFFQSVSVLLPASL
ncbi:MAG: class E sortase [Acidimicrobiales bacterium]